MCSLCISIDVPNKMSVVLGLEAVFEVVQSHFSYRFLLPLGSLRVQVVVEHVFRCPQDVEEVLNLGCLYRQDLNVVLDFFS